MHIEWVCVFFIRSLWLQFSSTAGLKNNVYSFRLVWPVLGFDCCRAWQTVGQIHMHTIESKPKGKLHSVFHIHIAHNTRLETLLRGREKKVKSSSFCKVHWNFNLKNVSLKNPPSQTENHQFSSCPPFFAVFPTISFSLSLSFTRKNDHIQLVAIRRAYFLSFSFRIRNQVLFQLKCLSKIDNLLFSIIRFSSDFRRIFVKIYSQNNTRNDFRSIKLISQNSNSIT